MPEPQDISDYLVDVPAIGLDETEPGDAPEAATSGPMGDPQESGASSVLDNPAAGLEPEPGPGGEDILIPVLDDFQALPDSNTSIPPDTMGAAGPNHLMTMLNTEVRIQDKLGNNLGTVSLGTWWTAGTGLSGTPFDPRVIYDPLSGRWMAVVDAGARDLVNSRTWFAVSATSDPTGSWTYYSINMESPNTNALWHDFPDIGTNQYWVAITNNMFDFNGVSSSFQGLGLVAIDKRTLGGALTVTTWDQGYDNWGGYSGFTLRIALTFDPTEEVLYLVDGNRWAQYPTALIRLSQITGTPSTGPAWSFVPDAAGPSAGSGFFWTTESYDPWYQINASQLGTSTRVQTNDSRLQNAVFRNGHLWFTHSGGRPNDGSSGATMDRTVVSWYEVDPLLLNTTGTPVLQSGTFDGGVEVHYFFPSIAANKNNDAAIGFSHSNPSIFVETVTSGRQSSDPPGTMDPLTTIKAGEDSYVKDFGSGRIRWGDYSATVVDPADDTTFWSIQEYAALDVGPSSSDDRWGTWWAKLSYTTQCGGDELAADFGANGVWHRDAGVWSLLTNFWNPGPAGLAGWAGGMAADFDANGVWNHDGAGWTKIASWNAGDAMAGWANGLAVDFDALGLWNRDGSGWTKIAVWNAEALACWSGGLAADFGANGVWNYDGASWTRLATWNAGNGGLSGWENGLAVDFDALGTWNYDGASWAKIASWNAGAGGLAGWTNGLAVDFDAFGLWNRNTSGVWSKLSPSNPGNDLVGWSTNLAVDFDAGGPSGLWIHNGSGWSRIATWEAEALSGVDLN